MEKIIYDNNIIAIRIKKFKNGITPITDPKEALQLVLHKRSSNTYTKPHTHSPKRRITEKLQECLVVISGRIKIDLYSPNKKHFKSIYLSAGQAIIFMYGGHGVHTLKGSEFMEIKNGPFVEDKIFI